MLIGGVGRNDEICDGKRDSLRGKLLFLWHYTEMGITSLILTTLSAIMVTLGGNPVSVQGHFPEKGEKVKNFTLVKSDLSELSLESLRGKRVVLNIFPSLDTKVCAMSVRKFNQMASDAANTVVLAISMDLPFAHARFCTTEGIENVIGLSAFRNRDFAGDYGVEMTDGPLAGLLARAVVVIDEQGRVMHSQLVPEITTEPDYEAAMAVLK